VCEPKIQKKTNLVGKRRILKITTRSLIKTAISPTWHLVIFSFWQF